MASITSAAQAVIAAADASPGESKENTLLNKARALVQNIDGQTGPFCKAAEDVVYFYNLHLLTIILTEHQVSDWKFWLPMDLFEWRWADEIRELFPWWEFTYNTEGHYAIEPAEYVDPGERWKLCESTLRQPTFHTMYNLPNDEKKITYWDLYCSPFPTGTLVTTRQLKMIDIHPEVRQYILDRGCPKDLEDFVWSWAEDDRELNRNWQKWALRGIEDHIVTITEKITGVTMEQSYKQDPPPPLRRQATWVGKFYKGSDACPPRERVEQEGDDTIIMVEIRAPESLREWCKLEMSGPKDNPMWKQKGLPAGLDWMIDVIWANLTPWERKEIKHMLDNWRGLPRHTAWLNIQLLHNFGDCFTEASKKKVHWMLHPRTVKY
uniref:Uncharacterized protein n=1 Tax=viral metagenome TaxID=1070528 RepID=A0A6C0CR54_9ZZZZ